MKLNSKAKNVPSGNGENRTTHEGAPAKSISPEAELKRTLMAYMLWENSFYEDGVSVASRIESLVPLVDPDICAKLAVAAKHEMKLRHAPLFVASVMSALPKHKSKVEDLLPQIILRADEIAEFVSIYLNGRDPKKIVLSNAVKRGLRRCFHSFNEYQFAKYNRDTVIKLRDVLFMVRPKPTNEKEEVLFKKIADDTLETPDTWEVSLSAGKDKRATWERLIYENKLGGLALLRNLRNMSEVGVRSELIENALNNMNTERILPFRFISAAKTAPRFEHHLEATMLKCLAGFEKIPGKTVLLIDVSGSMDDKVSQKSDMTRMDAAIGLSILTRELCERVEIYTFSNSVAPIPPRRRGFALRDSIINSQPHLGTYLGRALSEVDNSLREHDRIIVFTDEQSHDVVPDPCGGRTGYMVNVASYKNGVGYGAWLHIDGWSEATLSYISAIESASK